MKALLASTLTALVLVTAAWAGNVTPGQLAALSSRVTKLERANAALAARVKGLDDVTTCLRVGWNAQQFESYGKYTSDGFATNSGNLTMIVSPASADGIVGQGYLLVVSKQLPQC